MFVAFKNQYFDLIIILLFLVLGINSECHIANGTTMCKCDEGFYLKDNKAEIYICEGTNVLFAIIFVNKIKLFYFRYR
jgi:hypothetical protein